MDPGDGRTDWKKRGSDGVDPVSRRAFWEMIKTLAEVGTTVFVTTHYLKGAENCNRVTFLHRGRILALEDPMQLKTTYQKSIEDIFIQMVEQAQFEDIHEGSQRIR